MSRKNIRPRPSHKSLEDRVFDYVAANGLFPGVKRLVIGVSGGQDSVCLLSVLAGLRDRLGIDLYIAHLNHDLRGPDSEADAAYVSGLARKMGLPATIERRDVAAYQAEKHLGLEEAAREVRYAFLKEVARVAGAEAVAVGHTLDDDIETVLMHLVRGAGLRGLRGLLPASHLRVAGGELLVVRPLLEVTREETQCYCREHSLAPRLDISNLSPGPLRNRIRHELVPLLESYNPRFKEALRRMSEIAADEVAFLDAETSRSWDTVAKVAPGAVTLDRLSLTGLPRSVQRHLLRRAIETQAGTLDDFEARDIEDVLEALDKPSGKRVELRGGLLFIVENDKYLLTPDPAATSPFPPLEGEYAFTVPGCVSIPGWQVTAALVETYVEDGPMSACLDRDMVGESITVRPRRPGDVFQPLGMAMPVKLKDFMINAGVPRAWRSCVPVFISDGRIIWIAGWRIDERVKVTPVTRRFLLLKMEPHD